MALLADAFKNPVSMILGYIETTVEHVVLKHNTGDRAKLPGKYKRYNAKLEVHSGCCSHMYTVMQRRKYDITAKSNFLWGLVPLLMGTGIALHCQRKCFQPASLEEKLQTSWTRKENHVILYVISGYLKSDSSLFRSHGRI